jgi:hypothetical protein
MQSSLVPEQVPPTLSRAGGVAGAAFLAGRPDPSGSDSVLWKQRKIFSAEVASRWLLLLLQAFNTGPMDELRKKKRQKLYRTVKSDCKI